VVAAAVEAAGAVVVVASAVLAVAASAVAVLVGAGSMATPCCYFLKIKWCLAMIVVHKRPRGLPKAILSVFLAI